MQNYLTQTASFFSSNFLMIFILILVFLLLLIAFFQSKLLIQLLLGVNNLKGEIKSSVEPKFIKLNLEASDLIDLAVEVWRLEQRFNKLSGILDESQKMAISSSVNKFKKFLEKNDIEVKDFIGVKYSSGLSGVEVISVENDSSIIEEQIKEVLEPAVSIKGRITKNAKVVLLANGGK